MLLAYEKQKMGINYSSNVGTIIYDQNLRNDGNNQANPPWTKDLSTFNCHQFQCSTPGATTILPAEAIKLYFFFMMMTSFQHMTDEINYVCRGENQMKNLISSQLERCLGYAVSNTRLLYVLNVSDHTIYKKRNTVMF